MKALSWILVCFSGIGIILSIIIYPIYVGSSISANSDDWSNFGEYVGGIVTPFIGLIGFCGVIITIINQNEANRVLLRKTQKQDEENKVLQLIDWHHSICNNLKIQDKSNPKISWTGRDVFPVLFDKYLQSDYKLCPMINPTFTELERAKHSFAELYKKHGNHFGFYMRNLYYVIDAIDKSTEISKSQFSNLVRAQLSISELQLIMYNCLFDKGAGFKPLVEKYTLLNGIEDKDMLDPKHRFFFKPEAFK